MYKRIGYRIEELILVFIIILQILDFLEILPGDIDFIKKIISWTAMGYLLYRVSLTKIFFANQNKRIDFAIILAYFLFIIKDFVAYIEVIGEEGRIFFGFFDFINNYARVIDYSGFYLGGILLIFIAFYLTLRFEIKKPSLMHVIHEEGLPARGFKIIERFSVILVVLVAFFVVVFNLMVEWLAIALDAPIVMIAIIVYLFIIIRKHWFKPETLIFKLGDFGEGFYSNFVKLFHYKKSLYLGITGMLVLHLLTDVGNFIIPYIFGLKDLLYFKQLGMEAMHFPIIHLLAKDIALVQGSAKVSLAFIYLFNLIAMLFFLIIPTFVWYRMFKDKELHISRITLGVVFSSLVCFLLMPAFRIKEIRLYGLVGVDILTKSVIGKNIVNYLIADNNLAMIIVAGVALVIGGFVFALSFNRKLRKDFFLFIVFIGLVFFGFYLYYYFISNYYYFLSSVIALYQTKSIFTGTYFVIFGLVNILFYIGGFVLFIYEIYRHSHYYGKLLKK